MSDTLEQTFRLDSKGRITLGRFAEGVSSFRATRDSEGKITLVPYVEIPARELWLHRNPEALAAVLKGIEQAERGELHDLGDFTQFAED
jgi:hypothetical protein